MATISENARAKRPAPQGCQPKIAPTIIVPNAEKSRVARNIAIVGLLGYSQSARFEVRLGKVPNACIRIIYIMEHEFGSHARIYKCL
jgi:hypothetical protein